MLPPHPAAYFCCNKTLHMANQLSADFSEFKLRVNIKTPIENVYRAWTTPMGLESWFLGKVFFTDKNGTERAREEGAQAEDEYHLAWFHAPDKVAMKGKVLRANGKNLYSFLFSKGFPVTISIYTEHGETICELIESNLPTDEESVRMHFVRESKGWIFYLANLKSVLEGGLDLRNRNWDIKNVITH